jgi:ribonucleoside-diphosphate reductase alpha chain
MKPYEDFIFVRNYSRYLWGEQRRETWDETVGRYVNNILLRRSCDPLVAEAVRNAILSKWIMPSMRALWAAGETAERANQSIYNCSYLSISSTKAFSEALSLLMNSCGVGYSIRLKHISQLPKVAPAKICSDRYVIEDSTEGWCDAIQQLIEAAYLGCYLRFDYSRIRPKGAPLKTKGGRASGPEVLQDAIRFIKDIFRNATGRRLTSLEIHHILCKLASIVQVGGVRRSALIALTDLEDKLMQRIFKKKHPHLWYANISAVYDERPTQETFLREWVRLIENGNGERGIFNLVGAQATCPPGRNPSKIEGTNPCGEISMRDMELCNLAEIIVRHNDVLQTLKHKAKLATVCAFYQSLFDDFSYLRKDWQHNCQEERLLGVSLTGIMDNPRILQPAILSELRETVRATATELAEKHNVSTPLATTCVKPSGTVSQLVNCSPGIHPRWGKYYLRSVIVERINPVHYVLRDHGVPLRDIDEFNVLAEFPIKSPDGAITRHDVTALKQLEYYLMVRDYYVEHNISNTIYVGKDEWLDVAYFLYHHWDKLNGLTFFPKNETDQNYSWLPYRDITPEEYHARIASFPQDIDWKELGKYESSDCTEGAQEFSCVGGQCML